MQGPNIKYEGGSRVSKYGFGVDVGGTTCKLGLFLADGTLLDKWEIPTNTRDNGSSILEDIATAIEGKMAEKDVTKTDVLGIGIGVPGPVLPDGTVRKCVNLGWGVINVSQILSHRLNLPVHAGNDANVAALGEMWRGGGMGHENVVMITLGTGVGGGIIQNGKILPGSAGSAGEIGHMKVRDDEMEPCGCGKYGCLEQYVSATGIVRMARKRLETDSTPTALRDLPKVTAKDVADQAKAGDKVAVDLMEELGRMLGTAAANVACVVNPEMIVIGGGVSKAGPILLDAIEKNFKARAFHACEDTKFALATLGNDAGIYGCMKLVLSA